MTLMEDQPETLKSLHVTSYKLEVKDILQVTMCCMFSFCFSELQTESNTVFAASC